MLGLFVCNEVSEDESTINLESQKLLGVKSRDKLTISHQANRYYTGHLLRALLGTAPATAAHLTAVIAAMKRAMILRMPSQVEVQSKRVTLTCPPQQGRKTLLL
jgi:ethanolamine utilization cobalamin adenosyltransferase